MKQGLKDTTTYVKIGYCFGAVSYNELKRTPTKSGNVCVKVGIKWKAWHPFFLVIIIPMIIIYRLIELLRKLPADFKEVLTAWTEEYIEFKQ